MPRRFATRRLPRRPESSHACPNAYGIVEADAVT